MVTMQDLKKAAVSSGKEAGKQFIDYNMKCNQIVDVIYDKVLEMMSKDKKVNPIKKKAVVKGAIYIREPTKDYINQLTEEEAKDVIVRILKIAKE